MEIAVRKVIFNRKIDFCCCSSQILNCLHGGFIKVEVIWIASVEDEVIKSHCSLVAVHNVRV